MKLSGRVMGLAFALYFLPMAVIVKEYVVAFPEDTLGNDYRLAQVKGG